MRVSCHAQVVRVKTVADLREADLAMESLASPLGRKFSQLVLREYCVLRPEAKPATVEDVKRLYLDFQLHPEERFVATAQVIDRLVRMQTAESPKSSTMTRVASEPTVGMVESAKLVTPIVINRFNDNKSPVGSPIERPKCSPKIQHREKIRRGSW